MLKQSATARARELAGANGGALAAARRPPAGTDAEPSDDDARGYSPPAPIIENEEEYLDKAGAARVLKVSTRSLDRWKNLGVGPAYCKVGAYVRYRRGALVEWLRHIETVPGEID